MYEALVARIRYHIQKANFMGLKEAESTLLLGEAADAIEKLQAHYCTHMIRNVHDRGDDSLCRVLRTEPPKEET